MDSHDVGRGRGGREAALGKIRIPTLIVSIPTDVLYPPAEQEELALLLPNAVLYTLPSTHGHDGFLIDSAGLDRALRSFRPGIFLAAA